MTAIVETVNLKKTYMLGRVPVNALAGINLTVEKGDCLYIFSDGYADQIGGEKGKKFLGR